MKTKMNKTQTKLVTSRGADPEFFIKDRETDKIVSAIEVIGVDKYDPIDLGGGVTLYYDNAMGEFTIPPSFSKKQFIRSFKNAFDKISTWLDKKHGGKYEIVIQGSHVFNEGELEHYAAKMVGCNPEFSADKICAITPPDFSGNLRSAGGHIAVGRQDFESKTEEDLMMGFQSKIDLVKLLDYYVGVPFTLIDNDPTSLKRREIYGSPSSHRPKEWGIEYRVLSCYWTSSPRLVELIYDLSQFGVEQLKNNQCEKVFSAFDKNMVNACIKENNKELAAEIIATIDFPDDLKNSLEKLKNVKKWDFYSEWGLSIPAQNKELVSI